MYLFHRKLVSSYWRAFIKDATWRRHQDLPFLSLSLFKNQQNSKKAKKSRALLMKDYYYNFNVNPWFYPLPTFFLKQTRKFHLTYLKRLSQKTFWFPSQKDINFSNFLLPDYLDDSNLAMGFRLIGTSYNQLSMFNAKVFWVFFDYSLLSRNFVIKRSEYLAENYKSLNWQIFLSSLKKKKKRIK